MDINNEVKTFEETWAGRKGVPGDNETPGRKTNRGLAIILILSLLSGSVLVMKSNVAPTPTSPPAVTVPAEDDNRHFYDMIIQADEDIFAGENSDSSLEP